LTSGAFSAETLIGNLVKKEESSIRLVDHKAPHGRNKGTIAFDHERIGTGVNRSHFNNFRHGATHGGTGVDRRVEKQHRLAIDLLLRRWSEEMHLLGFVADAYRNDGNPRGPSGIVCLYQFEKFLDQDIAGASNGAPNSRKRVNSIQPLKKIQKVRGNFLFADKVSDHWEDNPDVG
jgi:hypothetical protein